MIIDVNVVKDAQGNVISSETIDAQPAQVVNPEEQVGIETDNSSTETNNFYY